MADGSLAEWLTTGWGALWWSCQPCCVAFSWQWLFWHSQKYIRILLPSHLAWIQFWVEKSQPTDSVLSFSQWVQEKEMGICTQELSWYMHTAGVCKLGIFKRQNAHFFHLVMKWRALRFLWVLLLDIWVAGERCRFNESSSKTLDPIKAFWNSFNNWMIWFDLIC